MEKSPSIVNLAKALKQFHAGIGKITKDATNPFFNSKYATLSTILETIKQPLLDAGLSFTQFPEGNNGLTTVLMHGESGEYMQCTYFMEPIKKDPQAQGSVISYMRRYSLAAVLGLNLDEDDDANRATHGSATPNDNSTQAAPIAEKPWLDRNSKKFDLVVERLKNKTTTISQLSQYFKLNKEVRAELQSIIDGNPPSNGVDAMQNQQAQEKPWLNQFIDKMHTAETAEWGEVLTMLTNGTHSIKDIEARYKLSKEVREALKPFAKKS